MAEAQSALGSYLLTKRMERSGASIPEYLARYTTAGSAGAISESYYRDIESGRKQIRPQTADRLREQLDLDSKSFYYFLLRDLLPESVFDTLISSTASETFRSISDRIEKLERRNKNSSRTILNSMTDNITELDYDEIEALRNDEALLSVIHFVYNRDSATFDEIDQIYSKCGGVGAVSDRLACIFRENTIYINVPEKRVFRRSKTIKIPLTEQGRLFKREFVTKETEKSLNANRISHLSDGPGTLIYSVIVALSRKIYEEIEIDGISRLMSIVGSSEETLSSKDVKPFFVSMIFSSREDYNVNIVNKKGKNNDSIISH